MAYKYICIRVRVCVCVSRNAISRTDAQYNICLLPMGQMVKIRNLNLLLQLSVILNAFQNHNIYIYI